VNRKALLQSGHFPTLVSSFLYFDVSFMVWVLLGPMAPFLAEQLHLSATQKGLLTAIPLLGGSFFRPILGFLGDRIGGRRAGLFGMGVTLLPLIVGWHFAHQLWHFYVVGFLLGVAGASFAVALPLASRWYPPEQQGLVLGIAGAGNSGTLMATLFVPRLAQHFGLTNTFAIAMMPLIAVLLFFAIFAKDSKQRTLPSSRGYAGVLKEADTYWLCFLYSLTFGGFVGLTSCLSLFFSDQYHLSKVHAGDFTTIVVVAGSFLRPVGGWVADKVGGYRLLVLLLLTAAGLFAAVSAMPSIEFATLLLFLAMGTLGMGNGTVFQLVPLRFSSRVGIVTGVVGAAGGLGGFFLPFGLGLLKDITGHYESGFLIFSGCFLLAAVALLALGSRWQSTWEAEAAATAGIFSFQQWIPGLRAQHTQPSEAQPAPAGE
jgi:MFS transporter, NNP family, nitrate/nitrite transporter